VFANCVVLGWEVQDGVSKKDGLTKWKSGIDKKGGGILPCTVENVILTFKLLPDLFADLQAQANSSALFRTEVLNEDAKN